MRVRLGKAAWLRQTDPKLSDMPQMPNPSGHLARTIALGRRLDNDVAPGRTLPSMRALIENPGPASPATRLGGLIRVRHGKARALPWTRWGRGPQTPIPEKSLRQRRSQKIYDVTGVTTQAGKGRAALLGVWGRRPQRGPGAEPRPYFAASPSAHARRPPMRPPGPRVRRSRST